MKKLLALALFAIPPTLASAADLPSQYPNTPPPVIATVFNWSGFYLGLMGGYGMSTREAVNDTILTNSHLTGAFVGSTLGFNYQVGQFVIGIEDDGAWSGIRKTWPVGFGSVTDQILAFGSVTARAGFAIDNVLIYGKGGYAWMFNDLYAAGPGGWAWELRYHPGWAVGAGLEWAFAGTWSTKLEYMYARYLDMPYVINNNSTISADVQTVKIGINYRFGCCAPAVTARY